MSRVFVTAGDIQNLGSGGGGGNDDKGGSDDRARKRLRGESDNQFLAQGDRELRQMYEEAVRDREQAQTQRQECVYKLQVVERRLRSKEEEAAKQSQEYQQQMENAQNLILELTDQMAAKEREFEERLRAVRNQNSTGHDSQGNESVTRLKEEHQATIQGLQNQIRTLQETILQREMDLGRTQAQISRDKQQIQLLTDTLRSREITIQDYDELIRNLRIQINQEKTGRHESKERADKFEQELKAKQDELQALQRQHEEFKANTAELTAKKEEMKKLAALLQQKETAFNRLQDDHNRLRRACDGNNTEACPTAILEDQQKQIEQLQTQIAELQTKNKDCDKDTDELKEFIQEALLDPFTMGIMKYPRVGADGESYDQEPLATWLRETGKEGAEFKSVLHHNIKYPNRFYENWRLRRLGQKYTQFLHDHGDDEVEVVPVGQYPDDPTIGPEVPDFTYLDTLLQSTMSFQDKHFYVKHRFREQPTTLLRYMNKRPQLTQENKAFLSMTYTEISFSENHKLWYKNSPNVRAFLELDLSSYPISTNIVDRVRGAINFSQKVNEMLARLSEAPPQALATMMRRKAFLDKRLKPDQKETLLQMANAKGPLLPETR